MLPFSDQGKPVLLVDGFHEGGRTPAAPLGTNQQHMKTTLEVQSDGSVKGDIKVNLKGIFAADTRARMRHLTKNREEDIVKTVLKNAGYVG